MTSAGSQVSEDRLRAAENSLSALLQADVEQIGSSIDGNREVRGEHDEPFSAMTPDEIRSLARQFDPEMLRLMGVPSLPGSFTIQIRSDGTEAYVDMQPPINGGEAVRAEALLQGLADKGVIHGIDEAILQEAALRGATDRVKGARIASGTPSVVGEDGRIELSDAVSTMETVSAPPDQFGAHIPRAGIPMTVAGQAVARIIPPTQGTPGINVRGENVPAAPGNPCAVVAGKYLRLDPDSATFFSEVSGRVVLTDSALSIEKILAVPGDVDISIGHVEFDGDVLVRGYIRSGLTLSTDGDIVVEGGIECARVRSREGSILVEKGIQGGDKGLIRARYDLTALFAEHATLIAGGNIELDNAINCELMAGESILASERKGHLRGGRAFAGLSVSLYDCGSTAETPTLIRLGIAPEELEEMIQLKEKRMEMTEAREKARKALHDLGVIPETAEKMAETEQGKTCLRLLRCLVAAGRRIMELEALEENLFGKIEARIDGKVHVHGTAYPGVRIQIGAGSFWVTAPLSRVTFRFDAGQRKVVSGVLSEHRGK